MKAKSIAYHNSELIPQSDSSIFHKSHVRNWLKQIGEFLVQAFDQSCEPKVEQIVDRQGNISWKVSDPIRQQTCWFYSEADVRMWLEQRLS